MTSTGIDDDIRGSKKDFDKILKTGKIPTW